MMDRINLLPDDLAFTWQRRLLHRADRQFVGTALRVAGATLALLAALSVLELGVAHIYDARAAGLKRRQKVVQAELQRMQAIIGILDEQEAQLQRQIELQEQRFGYLQSYREDSRRWAAILQNVKRALPYGVWLTEMDGDAQKKMRLSGGAFDEDLVTQFMADLKVIPGFRDVAFGYTKKSTIGKSEVVLFEVTCQVVNS